MFKPSNSQSVADLQNNRRVFLFAQNVDAPTHPPTMNKPRTRTGTEQRLRDIRDALAEKVASERRPFGQNKENILPDTPQLRVKSLKGREQRLREIQDALADLKVVSTTTTTVSTLPTAKRSSSESSVPPPAAKRRRLQSSHEAVASVSPTPILPAPVSTTVRPTNPASVFLNSCQKRLEELHEKSSHEAVASVSPTPILPTPVSTTVQPTNPASVFLNSCQKQLEELHEKVYRAQTPQPRDTDCHIDEFFAQYPKFPYNPRVSVMAEFHRMCNLFGWKRSTTKKEVGYWEIDDADRRFRVARQAFNDAMAKQFNSIYGTDLEDVTSWKNLCRALGIIPIPKGLEECQEAVAATHVNIVDLVETRTTGEPVKLFRSEVELSEYTMESGKVFPRDNAYAGGLLRFLLRHILNPSKSRGRRDA